MVAQLGQMRIAGVRRDAEIGERIGLAADILRHFLKPDPVVTQQRFALHLCLQLVPGCEEAFRRYAPGKVAGEEWRVIVAELLAEPAEPSRQSSRRDAKRQQQSDFAVAELADGNDRADLLPLTDMPLPCREPIEGLEHGAVGDAFEAAPFGFNRGEIAVDAKAQVRRRLALPLAVPCDARAADIDRQCFDRSRFVPERRQCGGACHYTH